MKILGVVASHRYQGNSEVLVKEALMGAEEVGAKAEILRMTNYYLEPCTGCGRCQSGRIPCHIKDDFNHLLERWFSVDAIILGFPCYFLAAPGTLKLFLDRAVAVGHPSPLNGKPAAVIVPYGNRGFTAYAFVQPNILLHKFGMNIIDQALIQSGAPGDALINDKALERVHNMGKAVGMALKTGDTTFKGEKGLCPVCHDRLIHVLKDMKTVECGTCGIRGKLRLVGGKIDVLFTEEDIHHGRNSSEQWFRHHMYHVEPGKEYFRSTKELRKERRGKYSSYLPKEEKGMVVEPVVKENK